MYYTLDMIYTLANYIKWLAKCMLEYHELRGYELNEEYHRKD